MTRMRHFQEELDRLKATLLEMANLAESAVQDSIESLLTRDAAKAAAVIEADNQIDALELKVDEMVTQLLALQAPVAGDLRLTIMALKISNDLERVGDHAVNIANAVEFMLKSPPYKPMPEIEEMVRIATDMLNDALDAFVRRDSALA